MDVTLIIPAHNEEGYIGACLDSFERYGRGFFKEVIVVDNASTDKTAEIARSRPGVRVVRTSEKGLTHARQAGLEAASSEYLAFIDADCRITPRWTETIAYYFKKYPHAVSLTGPVRYHDGPAYLKHLIMPLQWLTLPAAYLIDGYHIIGGNFIARRDALIRAGGFDKTIAFYGEDSDIGRRLAASGPVLLRMNLIVETSTRRLMKEGVWQTYWKYTVNTFSHAFLHRSLTSAYTDVRS